MSKFTIEFSEEADRELEELSKELGTKSKAEVIRKALSLLNYYVQERKKGGKMIIENEKQNLRNEIVTL